MPRSFLKPKGNLLVLFDEEFGNPLDISIDTVSVTKVCTHISESSDRIISSKGDKKKKQETSAKAHLRCPPKKFISKILFASFGTPLGDCENYSVGRCHASNSKAVVERVSLINILLCSHLLRAFFKNTQVAGDIFKNTGQHHLRRQ